MKYIDGVFKILIGIAFVFFRVIESIEYGTLTYAIPLSERYEEWVYIDMFGRFYLDGEYAFTVQTYSYVPLIIALLFIIWGIVSLVLAKLNISKVTPTYRR